MYTGFILSKLVAVIEKTKHDAWYNTDKSKKSKHKKVAYAENAVPNIEVANSLHIVIELVNKRHSSWSLNTSDVIIGHIVQYLHQCLHDQTDRLAATFLVHCGAKPCMQLTLLCHATQYSNTYRVACHYAGHLLEHVLT